MTPEYIRLLEAIAKLGISWRNTHEFRVRKCGEAIRDLIKGEAAMSNYGRDLGYDRAVRWANDFDAKMRQEEVDSDKAEAKVEQWRHTPHAPVVGLLGPNFCERCSANLALHDQPPYGETRTS